MLSTYSLSPHNPISRNNFGITGTWDPLLGKSLLLGNETTGPKVPESARSLQHLMVAPSSSPLGLHEESSPRNSLTVQYLVVSPKIGGPQYRLQLTIVLTIGSPKIGTPILRKSLFRISIEATVSFVAL